MISKAPPRKRIRRLPADKRQKVSTACDSCKRRKFKCTGQTPCDVCVKKGLDCTYTIIDKRSLKSERMAKKKLEQENKFRNSVHSFNSDSDEQEDPFRQQSFSDASSIQISPAHISPPHVSPPQVSPQPPHMAQQVMSNQYLPQVTSQLPPPPHNQYQPQPPPFQQPYPYAPQYSVPQYPSQFPPPQQQPYQPQMPVGYQQPPPPAQIMQAPIQQQQPPPPHAMYDTRHPSQQISPTSIPDVDGEKQQYVTSQSLSPEKQPILEHPETNHGILTPETTPNSSYNGNGHYIPKSLQPLLSFPLNSQESSTPPPQDDDEVGDKKSGEKKKDGISNQAGKSAILLVDKSNTFRYMGETSPLSLLYETRNIFIQYVGKTKLTEDLRGCPVIDKPAPIRNRVSIQLPPVEERDTYINQFKWNINDTFFIFDMDRFYKEIVEVVYRDPMNEHNKAVLIILYFVLAIGATYNDFSQGIPEAIKGAAYFDSGLNLLKDVVEDSEIWVVISHYLQFHYYQSILKKSTAWIHLNLAIKYAQSIGLHRSFVNEQFSKMSFETEYRKRLFRSLYCSDRISSVFIGRPLSINDYDWDDPTRFKSSNLPLEALDFNCKCQIELSKICTLIGRIVNNFYRSRIIDINRTKNLAIELKLWSKNLDSDLSIENIMKPGEIPNNEMHGNTQILLMMHLLQLYAIMLLSRPFFMYDAVSAINPEIKENIKDKELVQEFRQAAAKSSILAIKLMNHYINTAFKDCKRMECYIIITCCFYSSIMISITILCGGFEHEGYSESDLVDLLKSAKYILNHFSKCNKGAERYQEISFDMIDALVHRHDHDISAELSSENESVDSEEQLNYRVLNDYNFIDDPNNNLQSLIEFQQFFVPQEIAPTTSGAGGSGAGENTTMPFDYGNYDLFFGDKY
ncbi:Filamentous growth regulator 27 [Spathaspora sp. JA1]|nr:Filamentous growth regulator 27 [Spathaspora sp. JA1]